MQKPNLNFIVPGFSKCGTTTLCSLLDLHPELFIPSDKEPLFFIKDDYEQHWSEYQLFFKEQKNGQLIGEGSTFYTAIDHEQDASQRVLNHYPNIKLIFIARDPIDRIESSFREFHHSGTRFGVDTPYQLDEALHALPAILNDSKYWARLNCFLSQMPRKNIHTLFLEDLKNDPDTELKKCFHFLGVETSIKVHAANQQLNTGESKLYDTRILRWLRNKELIEKPETEQIFNKQNIKFKRMGLRRHFSNTIEWSDEAKSHALKELRDDIEKFLTYNNKPIDYWKRFHREILTYT